MNTDDLVTMLATGPGMANAPTYRFVAAIAWGALGATCSWPSCWVCVMT